MRWRPRHTTATANDRRGRSGVTLVEISMASLIFTVIAFGMVTAASMGVRTEQAVSKSVVDMRALHDTCAKLEEEIGYANLAGIQHEVDPAGFSTIEFQVPIDTDLGLDWGAYDKRLGTTELERSRAAWVTRFFAEIVPGTDGERRLVRQILDDEDTEQLRDVLVERVDTEGPLPGFTAEDTGTLWVLTVRLPADENDVRQEAVIHVRSRN